jgi:tetratricopeptide (TPR) repeat protein
MRSAPSGSVTCFALFFLCWPLRAWAQPSPEGAGAEAAPAAADAGDPGDPSEALRQAVAAYEQGDLANARRLFETVHRAAPTARTLRSLGLVAFRQQRYADAIDLLQASLASQQRPLTDAQREGASTVLAEARAHVARAEQAPPPEVPLSPPQSNVETELAPVPSETSRLEPQPAPVQRVETKLAVAAVPRQGTRAKRIKRAGYALLGVALAAVVTSATSYLVGVSRLRGIERECRKGPDRGCELEYVKERERKERLDMLSTLSLASGILGGVSAAGGGALLIWQWRSEARSVGQATFGVGWRGHF